MTKKERLALDNVQGEPILFYRGDDPNYGYMSSFSMIPIVMPHPWEPWDNLRTYDTREHWFQACKATTQLDHEYVAGIGSNGPITASVTKTRGRQIELRPDWGRQKGDVCWLVMVESIFAVCLQHRWVGRALIETGKRHIYEDSPIDDIWGWRFDRDYRGKNLLGEAWMHVRSIIDP